MVARTVCSITACVTAIALKHEFIADRIDKIVLLPHDIPSPWLQSFTFNLDKAISSYLQELLEYWEMEVLYWLEHWITSRWFLIT